MPARLSCVKSAPAILIAELTHRCLLGCPYCSNPLVLAPQHDELDLAEWERVFVEAAALGVRHVRLSGGEPGLRQDLVEIVAAAREAGLYTSLVTSGVGITTRTMRDLWEAGLDAVHVSFQDSDAVNADRLANHKGAFQRKHALAGEAARLGLNLTIGLVVHRTNVERIGATIDLALVLKANRIVIEHLQYSGWALENRALLMPLRGQLESAAAEIEQARLRHGSRIVIDITPSGCERHEPAIHVMPSGVALPCRSEQSMHDQQVWNIREHALEEIWTTSSVFRGFHGESDAAVDGFAAVSDPEDLGAAHETLQAYRYRR